MPQQNKSIFGAIGRYIGSSVVPHALIPVSGLLVIVAAIVAFDNYVIRIGSVKLPFNQALTGVLGWILVFRNNHCYGRFWTGRSQWSKIATDIKSLATLIWIQINPTKEQFDNENKDHDSIWITNEEGKRKIFVKASQVQAEKELAMKQLLLLCHSFKNQLRHDHKHSQVDEDYYMHDTRRENTFLFTLLTGKKSNEVSIDLRDVDKAKTKDTPATLLNADKLSVFDKNKSIDLRGMLIPENPLELLHELTLYVHRQIRYETLNARLSNIAEQRLTALNQAYHTCIRISRTPIPRAYRIHLQQALFLYCICFPFTVIDEFGWWTLLIMGVIYFVYIGLYLIGSLIENPFGNTWNAIPMERIIREIEEDLYETMQRPTGVDVLPVQFEDVDIEKSPNKDVDASKPTVPTYVDQNAVAAENENNENNGDNDDDEDGSGDFF